jgi:hypothetical protein
MKRSDRHETREQDHSWRAIVVGSVSVERQRVMVRACIYQRSAESWHELHPCTSCHVSADHGAALDPAIGFISQCHFGSHVAERERDHKQLRRHPTATGSSTTGVPPSRGRLPAQPRDSAVNPTRPPTHARGRGEAAGRTGDRIRARSACGTGRERRANAQPTIMPTISTGAHTRRETHGLAGSLYEGAARRYELSGRRMGRTTTRPVMAQRGRTRAG